VARPDRDPASSPWVGRIVVYGLVALIGVAAAADAEWWPVSSMRLFSEVRSGTAVAWEVRLVAADGTEELLDVASLGRAFRGAHHLVPTLPALPAAERDAICAAWAEAAADQGRLVASEVRVDRVVRSVPRSAAEAPVELSRTESVRCAGA
jgi:hypothetical protein